MPRKKYYDQNKELCNEKARIYQLANKERIAEQRKEYLEKNKEKVREWHREYRERNKEVLAASKAKWEKENPSKVRARRRAKWAKRDASKIQATPAWVDSFFVSEIYDLATRRTEATGIEWHVDHIVPLRSALVCGLHCETNLRVITSKENMTKSNFYWPDMP